MGVENPRQISANAEWGSPEYILVDSLIELSRTGEIEWDFSSIGDVFDIDQITTEVKGVKFISYIEREGGVKLQAVRKKSGGMESVIEFSGNDAARLRLILQKLFSENPVIVKERRRLARKTFREIDKLLGEIERLEGK